MLNWQKGRNYQRIYRWMRYPREALIWVLSVGRNKSLMMEKWKLLLPVQSMLRLRITRQEWLLALREIWLVAAFRIHYQRVFLQFQLELVFGAVHIEKQRRRQRWWSVCKAHSNINQYSFVMRLGLLDIVKVLFNLDISSFRRITLSWSDNIYSNLFILNFRIWIIGSIFDSRKVKVKCLKIELVSTSDYFFCHVKFLCIFLF